MQIVCSKIPQFDDCVTAVFCVMSLIHKDDMLRELIRIPNLSIPATDYMYTPVNLLITHGVCLESIGMIQMATHHALPSPNYILIHV